MLDAYLESIAKAELRKTLPTPSSRRSLGSSPLLVSPFCLGLCGSPEVVLAAFDAGINFFFVTTDLHWPAYEPLRKGLAELFARGPGVRDEVTVAAASYVSTAQFTFGALNELREAIPGLKRIDVGVIGGAYPQDFDSRLSLYLRHKRKRFLGMAALGTSFHHRALSVPACNSHQLDVAFIRYNPLHPGATLDVLPHLEPNHAPIYGFKSTMARVSESSLEALGLAQSWCPHLTDYYRFTLSRSDFDGVLCSLSTVEQVEELAQATTSGPLTHEEMVYMVQLSNRVHQGKEDLDGWVWKPEPETPV